MEQNENKKKDISYTVLIPGGNYSLMSFFVKEQLHDVNVASKVVSFYQIFLTSNLANFN